MKKIILYVFILAVITTLDGIGQTVHKDQLPYFAAVYGLKSGDSIGFYGNQDNIDFNKLINWFINDSDSSLYYLKSTGVYNRGYWAGCRHGILNKTGLENQYFSVYFSSNYQCCVAFCLLRSWEMDQNYILTVWRELGRDHPDSFQYLGSQSITLNYSLEPPDISAICEFPDGSIMLVLSLRNNSRVCVYRGFTLTDFKAFYNYKWYEPTSSRIDLGVPLEETFIDTSYKCGYEYICEPAYQMFEILKLIQHIPTQRYEYTRLKKINTRIIDLWDLARKHFHIKGKFDRYWRTPLPH